MVIRLEFIVQTLNLHWKNICLTSFDLQPWEKTLPNGVAAEDDKKSVWHVL